MGYVAGSVERYCQICRVGSNSGERVIVEQHHIGGAGRCSFACSEVVGMCMGYLRVKWTGERHDTFYVIT